MFKDLRHMPDQGFARITSSTIPLLCYWRNKGRALKNIAAALELPDLISSCVTFEAETGSLGPRDKSSYSDVMIQSSTSVVAIEGKWTEGRYTTVKKWRTSDHRQDVLDHWLGQMQNYIDPEEQFETAELVYQMIHRCASACSRSPSVAVLLYQIFTDSNPHEFYARDLKKFVSILKPRQNLVVASCVVPLRKTEVFSETATLLKATPDASKSALVREAVASKNLFEFGDPIFKIFRR
jgi:hypothetical protein